MLVNFLKSRVSIEDISERQWRTLRRDCYSRISNNAITDLQYAIFKLTTTLASTQTLARANMFLPSNSFLPLCIANQPHNCEKQRSIATIMDTDMEIDPEIAAMMGFGSFGGNKKRKFGADNAFTNAQPAQDPQQVASKANAVPVAEARSRPVQASAPAPAPAPAPVSGK